jgi:hypothetical protein
MADTVKRSDAAILFYFFAELSEVASIPSRTPSTWTLVNEDHRQKLNQSNRDSKSLMKHPQGVEEDVLHLDARTLARECLKVLGHEMGVAR